MARASDATAAADVYSSSFKEALPSVRLVHTDDQVRGWIRRLVDADKVTVAARDGRVVGMMVVEAGELDQLYVAPGQQGQGVGGRLLELAKELSPGSLRLYTFQVNERARAFYEARGFSPVSFGDGAGNEEGEPDVSWSGAIRSARMSGLFGQLFEIDIAGAHKTFQIALLTSAPTTRPMGPERRLELEDLCHVGGTGTVMCDRQNMGVAGERALQHGAHRRHGERRRPLGGVVTGAVWEPLVSPGQSLAGAPAAPP